VSNGQQGGTLRPVVLHEGSIAEIADRHGFITKKATIANPGFQIKRWKKVCRKTSFSHASVDR
jgi:hypothetical protein